MHHLYIEQVKKSKLINRESEIVRSVRLSKIIATAINIIHTLVTADTDTNGLHLGVVVESVRAQLATHAGLFEAAKRHLVVEGVVIVDPHRTVKLILAA